jgi:hypothetical protein
MNGVPDYANTIRHQPQGSECIKGLVYFPNFSPNSTMQKEDSSSHQNAGIYEVLNLDEIKN